MGISDNNKQIEKAKVFSKELLDEIPRDKITVIGHSEGGTEATKVGMQHKLNTVTFNSYGVKSGKVENPEEFSGLITNFVDPHDPISKLRNNIGTTYVVESGQNPLMKTTPFGWVQAHRISNFGDCNNAVLKDDYKKTHQGYIGNIDDVHIANEDIGSFDKDMFKVYEPLLDKRMARGEIFPNHIAEQKVRSGEFSFVSPVPPSTRGFYRRNLI